VVHYIEREREREREREKYQSCCLSAAAAVTESLCNTPKTEMRQQTNAAVIAIPFVSAFHFVALPYLCAYRAYVGGPSGHTSGRLRVTCLGDAAWFKPYRYPCRGCMYYVCAHVYIHFLSLGSPIRLQAHSMGWVIAIWCFDLAVAPAYMPA
jgi:hypothetical protein